MAAPANTTAEQGADPAIVKRGELLVQQEPGCCLAAFCCCCFLCGPGTCPNAINDRWQQCYIVLQQGALSIYVNPNDVMPDDIINLYGSAVVLPVQPKVSRGNCIEVLTPKRSVFFCAATIADVQDWALAIQKAAIMETSGKLVVPPLLHNAYKHEASLHAATAAGAVGAAAGYKPPPVNPHAALRAAQEAKYGGANGSAVPAAAAGGYQSYGNAKPAAKPQSIALSPRAALLGNEVGRSDH